MPRGPQHGVQSQIHMGNDVAQQDDRHILAGIADRGLAGPEEIEDRIEEKQRHESERNADYEIEHQHIAQHPLSRFIVPLAQAHRDQRRSAHAHQRTERRGEVHQREGQREARNGQRPHSVADEDAIDHVVERRGRHGDDRRHGILHEQLADTLGSELQSRRFYFCCHKFIPFSPRLGHGISCTFFGKKYPAKSRDLGAAAAFCTSNANFRYHPF